MQFPCDLLCVSVFVHHGRDDLRQQYIILIRAELLPVQIQPAEQMFFLCCKLNESHTVAAILRVAVAVPHMPGMQRNSPLRHGGFQIVHILKGQVDRLGGAAQLFCHTAGIDGGRAALPQHIHRRVYNGLF